MHSPSSGKGGFANSKDLDKGQTSLRKGKESWPSQHIDLGEEADGILYSFGLSDDRKKYTTVSNKFKDDFGKQINFIYK